jgi:hypothetical protein
MYKLIWLEQGDNLAISVCSDLTVNVVAALPLQTQECYLARAHPSSLVHNYVAQLNADLNSNDASLGGSTYRQSRSFGRSDLKSGAPSPASRLASNILNSSTYNVLDISNSDRGRKHLLVPSCRNTMQVTSMEGLNDNDFLG